MVVDHTMSFSPISFSHSFSFDDFIAHTFPDVAMDLDSFA